MNDKVEKSWKCLKDSKNTRFYYISETIYLLFFFLQKTRKTLKVMNAVRSLLQ